MMDGELEFPMGDDAMFGMIDAEKRGGSGNLPAFRSWKTGWFSFGHFAVGCSCPRSVNRCFRL
jgi:hypothetical protein